MKKYLLITLTLPAFAAAQSIEITIEPDDSYSSRWESSSSDSDEKENALNWKQFNPQNGRWKSKWNHDLVFNPYNGK